MGLFMGRNDYLSNDTLSYLVRHGYVKITFEDDESFININEADNFVVKDGDEYVNIYVRSKIEGRGSNINHGPSVKVCKCNSTGAKNGEFYPYKIPNGNKVKEPVIVGDGRDHKKFDRDNGKIIKSFIKNYNDELLEYWNTESDLEGQRKRDEIKAIIDRKLKEEEEEKEKNKKK